LGKCGKGFTEYWRGVSHPAKDVDVAGLCSGVRNDEGGEPVTEMTASEDRQMMMTL